MGKNFGNTPGPTPGPKGAVSQHKAMASGYELPKTPCTVDTFQKYTSTGSVMAPGLTSTKAARAK